MHATNYCELQRNDSATTAARRQELSMDMCGAKRARRGECRHAGCICTIIHYMYQEPERVRTHARTLLYAVYALLCCVLCACGVCVCVQNIIMCGRTFVVVVVHARTHTRAHAFDMLLVATRSAMRNATHGGQALTTKSVLMNMCQFAER